MYCPKCGQQQPSENLRYCTRCGSPVGGFLATRRQDLVLGSGLIVTGVILLPLLAGMLEGAAGKPFASLVSSERLLNSVELILFVYGLYLIISALVREKRLRQEKRNLNSPSMLALEKESGDTSKLNQRPTAQERTTKLLKDRSE